MNRQANIAICPFSFPASLPLGPAIIKAYAEQHSDFKVTCIDLNAEWYNIFVDATLAGRSFVSLTPDARETFRQAAGMFRNGGEVFWDEAHYLRLSRFFEDTIRKAENVFLDGFERACVKGEYVPAIKAYAEHAARRLVANDPAVVGFSLMFREQYMPSVLIAYYVKALRPDVKIVFGGGYTSACHPSIPFANPFIDFVVFNEGEGGFNGLLEALAAGRTSFEGIANLIWRSGEAAESWVRNEKSPSVDFKTQPYPDFSDYKLDAYFTPEPVFPIMSSKGCAWDRCTFCTHHRSYSGAHRAANTDRVVGEIAHMVEHYGVRRFAFVDEMISPGRFRRISEELIEKQLDITWYALAKPDLVYTEEILDVMHRGGCRYLLWGVESATQRVIDLMDKGTSPQGVAEVLARSTRAGIRNHLFMIVGFPSETPEEFLESMEFLYDNQDSVDRILACGFSLDNGSIIFKEPERFGISRIWDVSNIATVSVKYDVTQGVGCFDTEKQALFWKTRFFDHFEAFRGDLGLFRNHALLHYTFADRIRSTGPRRIPHPRSLTAPALAPTKPGKRKKLTK
jgi:anaerobic magnesium-protoporphyrin IX monomethyl ester cyclase